MHSQAGSCERHWVFHQLAVSTCGCYRPVLSQQPAVSPVSLFNCRLFCFVCVSSFCQHTIEHMCKPIYCPSMRVPPTSLVAVAACPGQPRLGCTQTIKAQSAFVQSWISLLCLKMVSILSSTVSNSCLERNPLPLTDMVVNWSVTCL